MKTYQVTLEVEFQAKDEADAAEKAKASVEEAVADDFEFDALSSIDCLDDEEEDEDEDEDEDEYDEEDDEDDDYIDD